jgi:hypothetical protein
MPIQPSEQIRPLTWAQASIGLTGFRPGISRSLQYVGYRTLPRTQALYRTATGRRAYFLPCTRAASTIESESSAPRSPKPRTGNWKPSCRTYWERFTKKLNASGASPPVSSLAASLPRNGGPSPLPRLAIANGSTAFRSNHRPDRGIPQGSHGADNFFKSSGFMLIRPSETKISAKRPL